MGEESAINFTKKRNRENSSELDSAQPQSKRVHSVYHSNDNPLESERVDTGNASDSSVYDVCEPASTASGGDEINEGEVISLENGIPEDILNILNDVDTMPEIEDLDSVIRSFEEEILQSSPSADKLLAELRSDSGDYQPDLGYLLEASDDELGLPPTVSTSAEQTVQYPSDHLRNDSEGSVLREMPVFENELLSYDSFGFELGERAGEVDNVGSGLISFDGLFECSEPPEFSDFGPCAVYTRGKTSMAGS